MNFVSELEKRLYARLAGRIEMNTHTFEALRRDHLYGEAILSSARAEAYTNALEDLISIAETLREEEKKK